MEIKNIIMVFECIEDFIYEKPDENEKYLKGERIELQYNFFEYMVGSSFLSHFRIVQLKSSENEKTISIV